MTASPLPSLDVGIVAGYFLLTIALGLWFGRKKIVSNDDLFLAGRESTWPVIGASLFSANISSQQFVGQAGLAYTLGLVAGAFQLVGALCFTLLAVFFVDVYLTLKLRTAPEFFERRYNPGARLLVSGINIVMIVLAGVAPALYAGAVVLTDFLGGAVGLSFGWAVVAIALAAGLYTVFGGLRSVLWTDLLQAGTLVGGGIITFAVCLSRAGGWAAFAPAVTAGGSSVWSVVQPWQHAFGWLPLITGAVVIGVHGHCTDQDYVQRALSARSAYHAKMGALFAAFLKIAALFIIAAPGVLAIRLLPGLTHPDQAYARLVSTYVPGGLRGVVLAGLLAAILGTVAAGLSAAASLLSYDFVLRIRPSLTERARTRLGRGLMVAVLLLAVALAPGIRAFSGLFAYLVQLWSVLAPPVFVCVLAGVFVPRASSRGAMATLATGALLGAASFFWLSEPGRAATLPVYLRNSLNVGFLLTLACALAMAVGSALDRPAVRPAGGPETAWTRARAGDAMSAAERRIYRGTLAALIVLWLAVVVTFSPLGVGRAGP